MSQASLESGSVYDKSTCNANEDDNFNAFNYILNDIKKDESERYPSIRTSLNIVYANDSRRFSVRCWTRKSKHYGPTGVFANLRPCQFFVTGKYTDGKSAAKVNRCRLKHECQEESFKKAKARIERDLDDPEGVYSSSQRQRRTYKRTLNEPEDVVKSAKKSRTSARKVRSVNDILYKARALDGKLLTPKQALQALRERKNNLKFRIESGDVDKSVLKEFTVATEELCMAEFHMKSEGKKVTRPRQKGKTVNSTQSSSEEMDSRKLPETNDSDAAAESDDDDEEEESPRRNGGRKTRATSSSKDADDSGQHDRTSATSSWLSNLLSKGIGK